MRNEAAERLRNALSEGTADLEAGVLQLVINDALATERRETVRRIREALDADRWYANAPRNRLNAILDEEAE